MALDFYGSVLKVGNKVFHKSGIGGDIGEVTKLTEGSNIAFVSFPNGGSHIENSGNFVLVNEVKKAEPIAEVKAAVKAEVKPITKAVPPAAPKPLQTPRPVTGMVTPTEGAAKKSV